MPEGEGRDAGHSSSIPGRLLTQLSRVTRTKSASHGCADVPCVHDIHSPRVPSVGEIVRLMRKAAGVVPHEDPWINPDCGLKTRGWPETEAALSNMVTAAKLLRRELAAA